MTKPKTSAELKKRAKGPSFPLAKAVERAGFGYRRTERVKGGDEAHGYAHEDGRAALVVHSASSHAIGASWTLKRADGSTATGKTAAEFVVAASASVAATAALSALRTLKRETGGTLDVGSIAGEDGYGGRLRTLKALRGTDRVRVEDAEPARLRKALHAAIGAANAGDFALKAAAALKAADTAARHAAAADSDAAAEAAKTARLFAPREPGPAPNPAPRKLGKAARARADEARARLARELRDAEGRPPVALWDARRPVVFDPSAARVLAFANGNSCLRLEEPNSQGALVVCDNGTRVAACVVAKKDLAAAKEVEPRPDLAEFARGLLEPGGGREVRETAALHLRVFLANMALAAAASAADNEADDAGPVMARPADHAQDAGTPDLAALGLLEGPGGRGTVLTLERANSQGALCVYNNGSGVALAVAPPEILRTLRPLATVDVAGDVNRLLRPDDGAAVAPAAASRLTAVLEHCKEITDMSDKKTSAKEASKRKFAPPAGAAKKAVRNKASKEPTERKSSLFRLVAGTKKTWEAFATQKGAIVAALVKLGAVGKTGTGATRGALIAALPDVGPKNISFYLSVWQKEGLIEKLAPAA